MSDYISSIENCVKLCNSVHGNSNYAPCESFFNQSNAQIVKNDTRVDNKGECFRHYIGARKYTQESECYDPGCNRTHRTNLIQRFDCTEIAELERLSSNLILLLNKAGHNSTKVKSACRQSHRQLHCQEETTSHRQCCRPHFQVPNGHLSVISGTRNEEQRVHERIVDTVPHHINSKNDEMPSTSTPSIPINVISESNSLTADKPSTLTGFSDNSSNSSTEESENDKQKKMKHNKLEQKRRSVINNKISELGSLLPENVKRSCRQKKGKILMESIDYIKTLKTDQGQVQKLQDKVIDTDRELRNLINRVEKLETRFSTQSPNNGRCEHHLCDGNNTTSSFSRPSECRRNVHDHHPNISSNVSTMLPMYNVYDNLATPYSVDSGLSVSSSSGMQLDDMNCYL